MRKTTRLLLMIAIGCVVAVGGQVRGSQVNVADLARDLQAPSIERRVQAVTRLSTMPDYERAMALRAVAIPPALVVLLERENRTTDELYLDGRGTSGYYGEWYSEYYSAILGLASAVLSADDLGEGVRRELLATLVRGTYNPDSTFVSVLAAYGDLVTDVAADLTVDGIEPKRINGYAVLGAALGVAERRIPMKAPLSAAGRRRALAILERGMMSHDVPTARHAIRALGESRTREALQMLNALLQGPETVRQESRYPTTRRQEVLRALDVIRSWQETKR